MASVVQSASGVLGTNLPNVCVWSNSVWEHRGGKVIPDFHARLEFVMLYAVVRVSHQMFRLQ